MNFTLNGPLPGGLGVVWVLLVWLGTAIVHIGFACAVYADSGQMWRHLRRSTFLVSGVLWALATLLGGVFVAAIYWLIHHSTLRPHQRGDAPAQEPELSGKPYPDSGATGSK